MGQGGLHGRWKGYVATFHGGNRKLGAEIQAEPSCVESIGDGSAETEPPRAWVVDRHGEAATSVRELTGVDAEAGRQGLQVPE